MLAESPEASVLALRPIPLFAALSDSQLAVVARYLERTQMSKGTVVIKEGEEGNEMYILMAGEVRISQSLVMAGISGQMEARDKVHTMLSATQYPFFGEVAVVSTQKRTATVTCAQDCEFLVMCRNSLHAIAADNPIVGFCILQAVSEVLSQRLHKANSDVLKLTTALSLALR